MKNTLLQLTALVLVINSRNNEENYLTIEIGGVHTIIKNKKEAYLISYNNINLRDIMNTLKKDFKVTKNELETIKKWMN